MLDSVMLTTAQHRHGMGRFDIKIIGIRPNEIYIGSVRGKGQPLEMHNGRWKDLDVRLRRGLTQPQTELLSVAPRVQHKTTVRRNGDVFGRAVVCQLGNLHSLEAGTVPSGRPTGNTENHSPISTTKTGISLINLFHGHATAFGVGSWVMSPLTSGAMNCSTLASIGLPSDWDRDRSPRMCRNANVCS